MLNKVKKGDPLKIPSEDYNSFVDAARAYLESKGGRKIPAKPDTRDGVVLVKNNNNGPEARFACVKLGEPIVAPADNQPEALKRITFGFTSTDSRDNQPAILQEPLPAGGIGRAIIAGVTWCQVQINDAGHQWAVPDPDGYDNMQSTAYYGAAKILWKAGDQYTQWAVVWLVPRVLRGFYARVEHVSTAYGADVDQWCEQEIVSDDFQDKPGGRDETTTGQVLREANGVSGTPVGAYVWVTPVPDADGNVKFRFLYPIVVPAIDRYKVLQVTGPQEVGWDWLRIHS